MTPCEAFEEMYDDLIAKGKSDEPMLLILQDCLYHAQFTGGALSPVVLHALIRSIDNLLSGRSDSILKKADNVSNTSPTLTLHRHAVSYVKTCRKHGYDESPVKTVCEQFDISDRTYRRWQNSHPEASADMPKNEAQRIEDHARMYRIFKK